MRENLRAQRTVLISILNWNAGSATLDCIDSIRSQNTDGLAIELAVIDNDSRPEEWHVLAEGAKARAVSVTRQEKNLGFAGGHNLSMQAAIDADMEFVWLVNNDATVHADALEKMIQLMDQDPTCGAVTPVCVSEHNHDRIDFMGARHDWKSLTSVAISSETETAAVEKTHPYEMWVAGTAVLFRVSALKQVGILNDKLFAYFEDNDISARLAAAGWKNRVAFNAKVIHSCYDGKNTNRPPYYFYLMQRNYFHFWRNNTPKEFRTLLTLRLLDRSIYEVNKLYHNGFKKLGDAALLGTSDGFWGVTGEPRLARQPTLSIIFLKWLLNIQHRRVLTRLDERNKLSLPTSA